MIEVKTGQRWRTEALGEVTILDDVTAIWERPLWVARQSDGTSIHLSCTWLNNQATLLYDPDEGEAPEVGSRWQFKNMPADEPVTVAAIVSDSEGQPEVRLSNGEHYSLWQLTDASSCMVRLPDEPTDLERYEAERRRVEAFGVCRPVDECAGCDLCQTAKRYATAQATMDEDIKAATRELFSRVADRPAPPLPPMPAGSPPTRDELLEHWMSLRPDDLHEGGWRRVGVALVGEQGSARSDLDTFSQWMNWEMRHPHDVIVEQIGHTPCMQNELRLYREEERRGKWWAK